MLKVGFRVEGQIQFLPACIEKSGALRYHSADMRLFIGSIVGCLSAQVREVFDEDRTRAPHG